MAKPDRLFTSVSRFSVGARLSKTIRHGVEAVLLAVVALGCVQAGWSLLTPNKANARGASGADEPPTTAVTEVVSPFAPDAVLEEGRSQALAAMLSGVQVSGVRMAEDPDRSGAVLTMNDGAQRSFGVGSEISEGVTLTEIRSDYVLVSYGGHQRRIAVAAAPAGYSYARALMGRPQPHQAPEKAWSDAPSVSTTPATQAPVREAKATAVASGSPEPRVEIRAPAAGDAAWLQATLGQVVAAAPGVKPGWRVADPMPEALRSRGLQAGDVIVSVNGAVPGEGERLAAAIQAPKIDLVIDRKGTQVSLSFEASKRS